MPNDISGGRAGLRSSFSKHLRLCLWFTYRKEIQTKMPCFVITSRRSIKMSHRADLY